MTYTFVEDSGHGWLKVPHSELRRLGIADSISPCSYSNGDYAYLEEDLDAGVFIKAMGGIDNVPYEFDYHDGQCYVRNYKGYPQFESAGIHLGKGLV